MSWIEIIAAVITAYSIGRDEGEPLVLADGHRQPDSLHLDVLSRAALRRDAAPDHCLGLMIYGWYEWVHGGETGKSLP